MQSPQGCLQAVATACLGLQTPGASSPTAMRLVMLQPHSQPLLGIRNLLRQLSSTSSRFQKAQLLQLLQSMALVWGSARHCRMISQQSALADLRCKRPPLQDRTQARASAVQGSRLLRHCPCPLLPLIPGTPSSCSMSSQR